MGHYPSLGITNKLVVLLIAFFIHPVKLKVQIWEIELETSCKTFDVYLSQKLKGQVIYPK